MYRSETRWRRLFILCTLCLFFVSSCGGGDDGLETVYLHVFNAYPGSEALSLYGPAGPVATGLGFGERTEVPVAVDRNLGEEFTLILDGAPEVFSLSVDLFTMYPQETGTFLVSQRRSAGVDAQIIRHMQATARGCRVAMHNSLALASGAIGNYNFVVGWDLAHNIAAAGYDQAREQAALGQLSDDRVATHNQIQQNAYFALVPDDREQASGGETLRFIWLGTQDDIHSALFDFQSGTFASRPPSDEYIECERLLDELDEVDTDINCNDRSTYNATTYGPTDGPINEYIEYKPESLGQSGSDCSASWRLFSDFGNIFFGEHGHDTPHDYVDVEVDFEASDHFFFVLFGRPVDPLIETWASSNEESGGGFEDIGDYPGGL